ncbi:hydroxyacid dehydrogenase [Luteimicrobium xylanilyticum]|uniref:Glyoxylate reductase n=1 Tax=Luteimicrobium xylanilyticum TaxID=1133546 RepID=A0A5P9QBQ7_9MICO|nr:hydroxyacid dehydrogenase [Luteimicrobium xylanilyticum]QFU98779.1 Glyoxylate reductase [Luteimicrobium xylanilyticum]
MTATISRGLGTAAGGLPRPVVGILLEEELAALVLSAEARRRLADFADVVALSPELVRRDPARSGVGEVDVLLTGWGSPRIGEAVLAAAPRLRAVVHAAGSVKWLVSDDALSRLTVSSAGSVNAVPVAQYTASVIQLATKRAFRLAARYRAGQHLDYSTNPDSGSVDRVIGIVGASRIGRLVIEALVPTGNRVVVADPYLPAAEARAMGVELVGLEELFDRSDVVSVHAPLLADTVHMIDASLLSRLRDGAVLVNTARGRLVDTDALVEECATGRIDAVLDVTDPEPLPSDHPLLALENVFVTPHIAGSSGTELRLLGDFAVDEIERLARGEELVGAVVATRLEVSA